MSHSDDRPLPLPYKSRLGVPLKAGETLNIHGHIADGAQSVEVNLLQGASEIGPNSQVALHVKLNFHDKKFIMNSFQNGAWEKEVRHSMSLKPGDHFDLRIRILEDAFELWADDKKIADFPQRLSYQHIEYLQVTGQATLEGVHWGGKFYTIPYESGFPGSQPLGSSQRLHVYGAAKGDRWNIDLIGRNGDILFHFNPRYKDSAIVRNSKQNGIWQNEEREGEFPLHKKSGFDVTIGNEPFSIQIYINQKHWGTFAHRTPNPANDYVGIRIDGDVDVHGIEFSH